MSKLNCQKPFFTPEQVSKLLLVFNDTMQAKQFPCEADLLTKVRAYIVGGKSLHENDLLRGVLDDTFTFYAQGGTAIFGVRNQATGLDKLLNKFTPEEESLAKIVGLIAASGRRKAFEIYLNGSVKTPILRTRKTAKQPFRVGDESDQSVSHSISSENNFPFH
jgi:hypothetical protein